jgi:hypothetical protein
MLKVYTLKQVLHLAQQINVNVITFFKHYVVQGAFYWMLFSEDIDTDVKELTRKI